ncbi:protein NUCLEAR FUSION DEFECTIVE 4-like isoform X2 [Prosopis cineraria]|uniref:protein NUCLEAR FUSION DEFECTIVE 4-like isoform X2 n=1 Tax=Prosopis cineraria TaxID=364024 RepID=UPI0024107138|nr:protein NUCLEAR FUSION DEFECTIVE 4-like isoform X2 [Prosopis cineraria]
MGSSIHRDELRLLVVLIGSEIGDGHNPASAQLSGGGFRHGKGIRMVLWSVFAVSSSVARHVHLCVSWRCWLRPSMARHSENHLFTLCSALYTFIVNSINSSDDTLYLLLNALVPLLISFVALVPILIARQQPAHPLPSSDSIRRRDFPIFIGLYVLSLITGLYLLVLETMTSSTTWARVILVGAVFLLVIPLFVPRIVYSRFVSSSCCLRNSSVDDDDDEIDKGLLIGGGGGDDDDVDKGLMGGGDNDDDDEEEESVVLMKENKLKYGLVKEIMQRDEMRVIYEEHSTRLLFRRLDFWLYYVAYLCGATIGLVYSNNIGQISESLGFSSETNSMVSLYSICSFFGRLLAAGPDFLSNWKIHFPRTGWYTIALIPTPIAFALLAASSGSEASLKISTGMLGLSSGFVFSEAVSITSELFGPNSAPVNHNILITNIPIGSCLFGLIAALVYDSNSDSTSTATRGISWFLRMSMCTGKKCYFQTFIWWGCISMVGLVSSLLLFLRTRMAYDNFERNRKRHRNSTSN